MRGPPVKPVDQLLSHDPASGQRGDCMRACLASILEVDPLAMPNWWDEIRRWLRDDLPVLGRHGPLDIAMVAILDDVTQWGDPYAIATVQSPRGPWGHCVVVNPHGVIAHDPYPTGKLTGPAEATDHYWVLVDPYDPYPTPIADLPGATP
jgi:hypothetical protein